jgi:two-component system NtrC family sensor kinase
MRMLSAILLLSVLFKPVFSQNKSIIDSFGQILSPKLADSLQQSLSASSKDSNRVLILHQLTYTILFSKPDSSMYFAQEGLKLARLINYPKGQVLCNADIGAVWWILGDYAKADQILLESLQSAELLHYADAQEWSLSFLLSNYRDQGNNNEALRYCFKGAAIHILFSKEVWNVITGSIYQVMNKRDSALFYLQQGDGGGYNLLMLAHTYAKMGDSNLSLDFYKKAILQLLQTNNFKDIADAYLGLARLYKEANKYDSSIFYAKKGLSIAQNASFKKWVFETSLILSRIYEKQDKEEALRYFKLAMVAKDSMFNVQEITNNLSNRYNEQLRQKEVEAAKITYENKIRIYALVAALSFFLLLAIILYKNNKHKQKANALLTEQKEKVESTLSELKSTQQQLIQSEKMASLGELTAGIAHEIQNPLNFVNNFSDVNTELIEEADEEIDKGNIEEVKSILSDIKDNSEKINHHGKRADAIVKGMLQHSRTSSGQKELTDINALADEYLRLSYHGLRAKDKGFNATIKTDYDESISSINIISQDIGRVLLNLYNNAFYAVTEKKKQQAENYEPTVLVSTKKVGDKISISVKDNGNGIPQKVIDKIFQPFFTTKPTGQGTGLGLSLSYDIIKAHGGEITVETRDGEGSEFIVQLR